MKNAMTRRTLLRTLGTASLGMPFVRGSSLLAQGRCMTTFGAATCITSDIPAVFAPTGWKTTALEQITFNVVEYKKEAAFYAALMGWTLRSDDGTQAVMDIGNWGTAIFKQVPASAFEAPAGGGERRGGPVRVAVQSYGYVIDNWNAKNVEAELRKRGLAPVADNGANGFESFRVKDPDGFDLQICNGNGHARARKSPATARATEPAPFQPTGWQTAWLDHYSFNAADYKKSASFYMNLLGWAPTYDEGSQHELRIGDIGGSIIRGGNSLTPDFGKGNTRNGARIDHISFGITPWDTDKVKEALEKRGLTSTIDTSDGAEIHVAQFKSYHTTTPNGYNLQISYNTHDTRLNLAIAVNPRRGVK